MNESCQDIKLTDGVAVGAEKTMFKVNRELNYDLHIESQVEHMENSLPTLSLIFFIKKAFIHPGIQQFLIKIRPVRKYLYLHYLL